MSKRENSIFRQLLQRQSLEGRIKLPPGSDSHFNTSGRTARFGNLESKTHGR